MDNRTQTSTSKCLANIGLVFLTSLLTLMTFSVKPLHAQATDPAASATTGAVHIGSVSSGNFVEYNPAPKSIHVGDSIQQQVTGDLATGTDASGQECTQDPNQPDPAWSWTCSTAYSSDNTTYGPSDSKASISGGQTATLSGMFAPKGYYQVTFAGHVDFYTNCKAGKQHLDTPSYAETFSVDGPDFDFTVTDVGINQGESGTFMSNLTSIMNFTGPVNFSNSDYTDSIFGVSGSGTLLSPGTAPITISVGKNTIVGSKYPVGVRGTAGSTTLYHDKTVTVKVLKRGVIVDALGTTYHKGPGGVPQKDANDDGSTDGVTHNTVKQGALAYTAAQTGFWSQNSSYHWFPAVGAGGSGDGTFNPDPIYALLVNYDGSRYSPNEHVHITLTDADGKHTATGNYYVAWHDPIERTGDENPNPPLKKEIADADGSALTGWITPGLASTIIPEQKPTEYKVEAGIEGVASLVSLFGPQGELASKGLEVLAHLCGITDMKWNSEDIPTLTAYNNQSAWMVAINRREYAENCPAEVKALFSLYDPAKGGLYGFVRTDMQYHLVKYYRHRTWPADFYSNDGYHSSGNAYVNAPDRVVMQPYYRYDPGPGPTQ